MRLFRRFRSADDVASSCTVLLAMSAAPLHLVVRAGRPGRLPGAGCLGGALLRGLHAMLAQQLRGDLPASGAQRRSASRVTMQLMLCHICRTDTERYACATGLGLLA